MEDRHFDVADKLLTKLNAYFSEARFMDEMTPKAAMDALAKIVAIQRVSLGLPSNGPLSINQQPEATSFEMIMRSVAQKQGTDGRLASSESSGSHTRDMINQVLADPTSAASLQEVIIRISQVSSNVEATPEKRFPGRPGMYDQVDEATIIEAEVRELNAGPQ